MAKQRVAANKTDIYETVTANIIAALEKGIDGNKWKAPWHGTEVGLPENVASHKAYRGANVWILFCEQFNKGYTVPIWGTFKQWKEKGCPVRKGEKSTVVLLWKPTERRVENEAGDTEVKKSLFARAYHVFNAAQVDGFVPPQVAPRPVFEVIEHAQEFFEQLDARVDHGGNRAYYTPAADRIQLPQPEFFKDSVSYYAVRAHETVHWTGHDKRCARDLSTRFGEAQYAAEELVAELGSAYVCGILGLSNEPREDHSQYIANWISLLKSDPKAIITAGSKAQQAVDYLVAHTEVPQQLELGVSV